MSTDVADELFRVFKSKRSNSSIRYWMRTLNIHIESFIVLPNAK